MNRKSFLESANGAILERADYELNRIFDNIMDPNTRAAKKRKLTLTIEFLPNDERSQISYGCVVKPSLEPTAPIMGTFQIVADADGCPAMVELVPQVPGQISIEGAEQTEPNVIQLKKA